MATNPPDKSKPGGLSLFASLLDPSAKNSNGTISRAPVVFKQPAEDEAKKAEEDATAPEKTQLNAAALRFQPTKRPQLSAQKEKAQRVAQAQAKAAAVAAALVSGIKKTPAETVSVPQSAPTKTTVADWTNDAEDDDYYAGEKRQRGGRKKRKKNKQDIQVAQDWDDIYDPTRPNNYEEYRQSDERIREIREWKDKLYAHRRARRTSSDIDSEDNEERPQMNSRFAPPSMSFAPPSFDKPPPPPTDNSDDNEIVGDHRTGSDIIPRPPPPPPPPPQSPPDDSTGEDAYARRMRLSQQQQQQPPPPPPPVSQLSSTGTPSGTISRAPIRYSLPEAPPELPKSEAELEQVLREEIQSDEPSQDAPRSSRPGQKDFAERLMSKYGWTKGTGLGADGSGIINPLRVQVEKQKKRPDSEGGGVIGPAGRGKIVGGQKKAGTEEHGKFGPMSEVIILRGMLDGMDIDFELGEGNLMQEIGEECGEKYGRVERVYVDRAQVEATPVFVKFTNQLSALRAVNALEGRIFNGNNITARFFDSDNFAKGIYT